MPAPFNASAYLVDRQVAEGRAERIALRSRGESVTYAELQARIVSASAELRGLGVEPEQRVVLVMLDSVDFVAVFLGTMRIGAIPVPLNPMLPGRELAAIAADARARVAFVSPERSAITGELGEGAPELREIVVAGERVGEGDAEAYPTWDESPGFWLCTSGTTGLPKLAMHRHTDVRTVAEGYAREVLDIRPEDVCFSVAPIFHAYGLGNSLIFPLAAGATAVVEPARPPTPALVAEIMGAERPTLFFSVPTFFAALLAADLKPDTFESVRFAVSAGEPLPGELFARFAERHGVEVLDGLGSTEMTHIFVSNRPGRGRPGSSGTPVGGYEVRITDDEGRVLGPGEPGHLWVRGDSAATGYWCRAEETRRTFCGDWVRTGDVYVVDADGAYTYLGRSDDMFKVGGEWVSPAEVEAALIEHPGILEAAVVAFNDPDGLLKPAAFVVPGADPPPTEDELDDLCRARLAGFKRPKRFVLREDLPKTATGKIQRFRLRSELT